MLDVHAAARRFRYAIESTSVTLVSFQNFPGGACGDASEMLGEYLRDCGLGDWHYRMGVNERRGTHAWVERDGALVDITADQFPDLDQPPPVIAGTDWSWHDRHFPSGASSRIAGLDWWTGPAHAQVSAAYSQLRHIADGLR